MYSPIGTGSLHKRSYTLSDTTITPSQWLKDLVQAELQPCDAHCVVIPSGLDIDRFEIKLNEPVSFRFPPGKKHIVCPARLDLVKGHDVLLDALAMLRQVRTDWICWLLGDGPRKANLQKRARELGISEQVVFAGMRPDVASLVKQADVVVLSSVLENRPFAVLEAQLAGTPVVVTAAGGIPEMVEDSATGLVCSIQDSVALSENLDRILSDKELRIRLAQSARQFAGTAYDSERMIGKTVEVYHNAQSRRIQATGTLSKPAETTLGREIAKTTDAQGCIFRKYVPAGTYGSLFRNDLRHVPAPPVPRLVWDRILANAPPNYQISDGLLVKSLNQDK